MKSEYLVLLLLFLSFTGWNDAASNGKKVKNSYDKTIQLTKRKNKINLLFEQNSCLTIPRNATTMDKFFSLFPIQEKTKNFLERSNFFDERINASREKFVWFHVKTRKNNNIERILQRLGSIQRSFIIPAMK